MPDWYKIQNKAGDVGELSIYGPITDEKWFDEDVTPTSFKEELNKLKGSKQINMYVNSPGGGVFAGMTIHSMLKRMAAPITAYIDGIAASIASVLVMAADKIIIPKNGMMMIHNPIGMAYGDAVELRKEADLLDRVKATIVSVYKDRTKRTEGEISKLMDAETWMTGKEAAEAGFADEVAGDLDIKACLSDKKAIVNGLEIDFSRFRSFPSDKIIENENKSRRLAELQNRHKELMNKYK